MHISFFPNGNYIIPGIFALNILELVLKQFEMNCVIP